MFGKSKKDDAPEEMTEEEAERLIGQYDKCKLHPDDRPRLWLARMFLNRYEGDRECFRPDIQFD